MARTCTLKGKTITLDGPQLKPGDAAPDATLHRSLVESFTLSDTKGQTRILSVVPSLDTPVCADQTRRFHQEASKLPNVHFYTISCDLPTGMARFCGAEKIDTSRFFVLSDYFDHSFGLAYGTFVRELRIECRAVFVVDRENKIRHAEYVPEIASHPNYDAVLACARQLAG